MLYVRDRETNTVFFQDIELGDVFQGAADGLVYLKVSEMEGFDLQNKGVIDFGRLSKVIPRTATITFE